MPIDPRSTFLTHSNYIRAIDTLIGTHYLTGSYPLGRPSHRILEALAGQVQASRTYARLNPRPAGVDHHSIKSALRNAWGTELLLVTTGEIAHDELIGIANNWAVVQAYYASYHAVQALVIARGEPRPQSHPTTQRQYSSFWAARPVDLSPWSLGWQAGQCLNLPSNRKVSTIHAWSSCNDSNCWDLVAMALRTTREDLIEARIKDERDRKRSAARTAWQHEEQTRLAKNKRPRPQPQAPLPRLTQADKITVEESLRPTTVLEYLYRLRIRSNYADATMFTDGPETPHESRAVHHALCRITSATLLVHELLVGKLIGWANLDSMVDEWLESPTTATNLGLGARRELLAE